MRTGRNRDPLTLRVGAQRRPHALSWSIRRRAPLALDRRSDKASVPQHDPVSAIPPSLPPHGLTVQIPELTTLSGRFWLDCLFVFGFFCVFTSTVISLLVSTEMALLPRLVLSSAPDFTGQTSDSPAPLAGYDLISARPCRLTDAARADPPSPVHDLRSGPQTLCTRLCPPIILLSSSSHSSSARAQTPTLPHPNEKSRLGHQRRRRRRCRR